MSIISKKYFQDKYQCDICDAGKITTNVYHCDICGNFDVCPYCWHIHPLKRYEWPRNSPNPLYPLKTIVCDECERDVMEKVYHCQTCGNFDLCETCGGGEM